MTFLHRLLLAALLVVAAIADAPAQQHTGVMVEQPYAPSTPRLARTGAVYFRVVNHGTTPDALIDASTPQAESVELHTHEMADGVARMRRLPEIAVPAGGSVTFAPGGYHVMLIGLKAPLNVGESFPVTLRFRRAGAVEIRVQVERPGSRTSGSSGHQH